MKPSIHAVYSLIISSIKSASLHSGDRLPAIGINTGLNPPPAGSKIVEKIRVVCQNGVQVHSYQEEKTMRKLFIIISAPLIFASSVHAAVNINTATQQELQTVSGITSAKAKAIIDYRSKAGKFRTTEDLTKVEGISPRYLNMKQLYKDVTVTGPTILKVEAKPAGK
jgi:competence protein ComEA